MKPVIGVMPLWDDDKNSIWMLPGYLNGITEAGGLPIIFPMTQDENEIKQLCSMCDGFLFTGGHDVNPDIYGQQRMPGMIDCCNMRDNMEILILNLAIALDKSVLGICRGIQFINAALGGSLYQDIPSQHPSIIDHHMSAPYDRIAHEVKIIKDSPLANILGEEIIGVNSYHHQAVKDLAPCLQKMAESEDGLIEALYMPGKKYIWAIQWHPEFSYCTDKKSRQIFKSFVDSCTL